jgi:hypothetical protein
MPLYAVAIPKRVNGDGAVVESGNEVGRKIDRRSSTKAKAVSRLTGDVLGELNTLSKQY